MAELGTNPWGDANRYYASVSLDHFDQRTGQYLAETLNQISPGIRDSVERTYKQWNTILRDYLRSETALRLTMGEDSQSVPVKIMGGIPPRFAEALRRFEGLEWLLLNRPEVEAAVSGTDFMQRHADLARTKWGDAAGPSDVHEIQRVHDTAKKWLAEFERMKAVEQIVGIDEDVLGAYFFRIPEIHLYWVVIGIIARTLNVSAEALTIVVLAHELAHAYTHLGRDIDNERWQTQHFAKSDLEIVEGLAQFYTQVICTRFQERMPAALLTYTELVKNQSGPYKAHLEWIQGGERAGEIVRVSMIECRSTGLTGSTEFAEAIKRYRSNVRGQKQESSNG